MTGATATPPAIGMLADKVPFDPDKAMAGQLRRTVLIVGGMILTLGVAGGFVPIGGAVIAAGQVAVESRIKAIAHPNGGTVAEIRVRSGQHVRKGQILVRLDDQVAGADADLSALTVDQMLAQKARLEAEQAGASGIIFPSALTSRTDVSAKKAMDDERHMLVIARQEDSALIAQLQSRIGQYRQQISGYHAQIIAVRKQSQLITPEREGLQKLYEKKLVTLNRLNQLERVAADLDGNSGALTAQIAQAHARISETRQQIIQIGQSRRAEAGNSLAALNAQLNQQQLRSISARDVYERTLIRAPQDGVVENLILATAGDVVRPADKLMSIVPDKDSLLIEGRVTAAEIDRVHDAQEVTVRLSAVAGGVTPEVQGRIVHVSTERVDDRESGQSYFPIRVQIDPAQLRKEKVALKPGMPVDMFIATGERTMISYITRPLRNQLMRAFRDH